MVFCSTSSQWLRPLNWHIRNLLSKYILKNCVGYICRLAHTCDFGESHSQETKGDDQYCSNRKMARSEKNSSKPVNISRTSIIF